MNEVAFRVKKGSDLYNKYFAAKAEKNKFVDLAHEFFASRMIADSSLYRLSPDLCLELTPAQRDLFGPQLKKYQDSDGLYCFKKNSIMQRAWDDEVISHVNMVAIYDAAVWYWPYISRGSQTMWDRDGELYGYLSNADRPLSEDMEPMKLSEYHRIIEEAQNK